MEWITARSALDRDFQRQGANLVDLAADGLVRTKAVALTVGRADPSRDTELSPSFWREMQRVPGSAYRDWKTGTFKTAIADFVGVIPSGAQRAVGVSFNSDDLDTYLPAPSPSVAGSPSQALHPQSDDEVILMLMHSRIASQQYKSINAAAQALAPIAHGGGNEESRATRLRKAYAAKFGGSA